MKPFYMIQTAHLPILEQLRLEEALLRADQNNWCLINHGSPDAIVMGISGKVAELVDQKRQEEKKIPLITRFSGGGTVYVDPETIFVTFIANEADTEVPCLPKKIMEWTEALYYPIFAPHPFALRENDYTMGEQKFGGNAQYVQKGRWLHHTSFLWDYKQENMELLLLPKKRPHYRQDREHRQFLTTLNYYYPSKEIFLNQLSTQLKDQLSAREIALEEALAIRKRPHRQVTR